MKRPTIPTTPNIPTSIHPCHCRTGQKNDEGQQQMANELVMAGLPSELAHMMNAMTSQVMAIPYNLNPP